ncbi:hypothetical protein DM860_014420 [Cuscuta australis]|uniref:Uncharacterized protein n=1 Tax=Cuscuta australis TaxID=267555 RepID=A0A328DU29_9ASTE|nr:hypothetical protein DM860_014420 [Cuscuta australis]
MVIHKMLPGDCFVFSLCVLISVCGKTCMDLLWMYLLELFDSFSCWQIFSSYNLVCVAIKSLKKVKLCAAVGCFEPILLLYSLVSKIVVMDQGTTSNSVPQDDSIDKSKILDIKPMRSLIPVFPSANGMSSAATPQPSPFTCVPPVGPFHPGVPLFTHFWLPIFQADELNSLHQDTLRLYPLFH